MKTLIRKIYALCLGVTFAINVTACGSKPTIPTIAIEEKSPIVVSSEVSENTEMSATEVMAETDNMQTTTEMKSIQTTSPADNMQIDSTADNTQTNSTANANTSSEYLFRNASLNGSIIKLSESELALSVATIMSDGYGGQVMVEAAPETVVEDNLVHVSFNATTTIQLLTMDRATQSQISLVNIDSSNLQEENSVLIFGSCQDTTHWIANQIVVVDWQ